MLLQSSFSSPPFLPHHLLLSSTTSYSQAIPLRFRSCVFLRTDRHQKRNSIFCWAPQARKAGTVDYERRTPQKWSSLYRRISLMENPEIGPSTVLKQWEEEGGKLTKWEVCRVVKQLRKFKKYKLALEVHEWMTNQIDRFKLSISDTAIQLDLISKVHGISSAEDYFSNLPESSKDKRVYGALLNAYVRAEMREKAESMIEEMRNKGYASHPLPYNVMMTLYINLRQHENASSMVSEMVAKNIPLDTYSYNIWLSLCGAMQSIEKMEQVYERMKLDSTIDPNWTTYSTMATIYIKVGQFVKAEDFLKKIESKITGQDRMPYHYLISLYCSIRKKEDVYRMWNVYKSKFPRISNLGYHAMISSLIRLDDIEGAENLYEEWLSGRMTYEPRICNLLIWWYVKEGLLDKAMGFLNQVVDIGGKLNTHTWEILAEGHIKLKQMSEALSCMKEAAMLTQGAKGWRPKPANVCSILAFCEKEGNMQSKEVLIELLKQVGCFEDEDYKAQVSTCGGAVSGLELSVEKGMSDGDDCGDNTEEPEMLLNQLSESL